MSKTLTISDALFRNLQAEAGRLGLASIEELLARRLGDPLASVSRAAVIDPVHQLFHRLSAKHGLMPDSVDLIREDRGR